MEKNIKKKNNNKYISSSIQDKNMKNIETPDKMHLSKVVDDLKEGSFVIPDFQRDLVWQPWDIVELIKAIFMDYYIGTLLLWKAGNQNIKALNCEQVYGYNGTGKPQHIVLDGQQRLTAIYYSFFAPEKLYPDRKKRCLFFLKIKELLNDNFDDAFYYDWETKPVKKLIDNDQEQYEKGIIPLMILGKNRYAFIDWIRGYRKYLEDNEISGLSPKNADAIEDIFRDLLESYYISYIELDRDIEITKVCDIFTKINSSGVPLSIFDLLNAILTPHKIHLKEMWRRDSGLLDYTDSSKMKNYVLQVMSILKQDYCSPRFLYFLVPGVKKIIRKPDGSKGDIILVENKEDFESGWQESVEIMNKTIQIMKNPRDFGAIQAKFVPYPSIIPPFAAVKKYVAKNKLEGKGIINFKIRLWYWASIFIKNYSSAVESQSAKDFKELKKWFENDELIPEAVTQFKDDYKYLDLKRETKQGSAIYNAIFNLLVLKGASDWSTFDLPEYSAVDDHHIVPNSWGKDKVGDDINSILNKTPLSPQTNRSVINKQLPNKYLKKMIDENGEDNVFELMESHLISKKAIQILLRDNFNKEDYYEFIDERKRLIIEAMEEFILRKREEEKIDYPKLILKGEGSKLEFKVSFSYSLDEKKVNKNLKFVAMKEITGFLNTNGGTLLIGIKDNGDIFGLEKDYEFNFRGDRDGFLQDFRSTMNSVFEDASINRHIDYHIEEIDDKEILVVDIEKSREAIFLKKGEKVLYVRRDSMTVPLTDSEEIHKHISENWKI
jgi:hypothetical protein